MGIQTTSTMSSPRVGKKHLNSYQNKSVRFVGKVISNQGGTATLEAPDGGEVQIQNSTAYGSDFVEIMGEVQSDSFISQQSAIDFGADFHMDNCSIVESTRLESFVYRRLDRRFMFTQAFQQ